MTGMLTPNTSLALIQASQGNTAQSAKNVRNSKEFEKFEAAAKDFEAVYITEMIKPMFEGVSTDSPFGGWKGEEVFRGLLINEYGKMLANSGGIGLSTQIREQMIAMQEQADNAKNTTK